MKIVINTYGSYISLKDGMISIKQKLENKQQEFPLLRVSYYQKVIWLYYL